MKVISKDRKRITMFKNGVWELKGNKILLIINHDEEPMIFAKFDTEEEAIKEFETFMNHACNANIFEFGKAH